MNLERTPPNWTISIVVFLIFALVLLVSNLEKALAAGAISGIFMAIILTKWQRRNDWRFWTIMAVFAIVHIFVITFIRIPPLKAGIVIAPFAFADGFIMWGVINLIERHLRKTDQSDC